MKALASLPGTISIAVYDTIASLALAKNAITIGAIEDIDKPAADVKPEDVSPTSFSSFGPTDSGRIKPDVVANGADLLSPTLQPADDLAKVGTVTKKDAYASLPGTSMAAPVATGVGTCCISWRLEPSRLRACSEPTR